MLHAILVIGLNVPVVLLPAAKLEPVAGSRRTSGKPRTLTAGGPCVHIAQPWSLASALAPPGGKRLQAHPPAVCLTQVSTARLQAEIRGKAAAKRILPPPSSNAKSLMGNILCCSGRLQLKMLKQIVVLPVRQGNCFLHVELYSNS